MESQKTELYIACPQQLRNPLGGFAQTLETTRVAEHVAQLYDVDRSVDLFSLSITEEEATGGDSVTYKFSEPTTEALKATDSLLQTSRGIVEDCVRRILVINPFDVNEDEGLRAVADGKVLGFKRRVFRELAQSVLGLWNDRDVSLERVLMWGGSYGPYLVKYHQMAESGEIAAFHNGMGGLNIRDLRSVLNDLGVPKKS
ncbi:MAG: hypothetical protein ABII07_01180 [Patescibacteria group bacterium]|nr:hypothetical protein [Patescibacteria group bacterium]